MNFKNDSKMLKRRLMSHNSLLNSLSTYLYIFNCNFRVSNVASLSGDRLYLKLSDGLKERFRKASTEADVCQLLQEFIE